MPAPRALSLASASCRWPRLGEEINDPGGVWASALPGGEGLACIRYRVWLKQETLRYRDT